jgi:hypothetical protein
MEELNYLRGCAEDGSVHHSRGRELYDAGDSSGVCISSICISGNRGGDLVPGEGTRTTRRRSAEAARQPTCLPRDKQSVPTCERQLSRHAHLPDL